MKLDPFYLIVDSAAWIERLVPLGVKLVQLRIKTMDEAGLRAEIRKAKAKCAEHHCQLIVNDHWRLAIKEGCDFVHLGQEDLQSADLLAIRAAGVRLGLSTHDDIELETAMAAEPDYIALGPRLPDHPEEDEMGAARARADQQMEASGSADPIGRHRRPQPRPARQCL